MTKKTIHNCMDSRNISDEKDEAALKRMRARGRIGNLNKLMAVRQWDVLPQGRRGQRILRWACHHVWRAADRNPERSVRNFCRKRAPYLKPAEVDRLVAATTDGCTTWWSNDQSAAVLDVGVCEREANSLWFLGACDDADYEIRGMIKNAKAMMRARRRRAAKSTGRPRGRPASATGPRRRGTVTRSEYLAANSASKVKPWVALGMKRSWYYELKKRGELDRTGPSENASRSYADNSSVTDLSVTPVQSVAPACDRRPLQAARRQRPIVVRLDEAPTGLIIDEDGNQIVIPAPHELPPTDWMEVCMRGYRGES
jgi:hypothetical protein